jgi:hypothetical protein
MRGGACAPQACHDLVPPETLAPVIRQLVDQFVHDRARPEVVTIGLKTVREMCTRTPLVMTVELLQVGGGRFWGRAGGGGRWESVCLGEAAGVWEGAGMLGGCWAAGRWICWPELLDWLCQWICAGAASRRCGGWPSRLVVLCCNATEAGVTLLVLRLAVISDASPVLWPLPNVSLARPSPRKPHFQTPTSTSQASLARKVLATQSLVKKLASHAAPLTPCPLRRTSPPTRSTATRRCPARRAA